MVSIVSHDISKGFVRKQKRFKRCRKNYFNFIALHIICYLKIIIHNLFIIHLREKIMNAVDI